MRVLVIEDDDSVRAAVRRALLLGGYEVLAAPTGQEGLLKAETDVPDAIVLDLGLPDIDGMEVCRRLRSVGNRTPILMLTARVEVEDRVEGLEAGADDYLIKPYDVRELQARLQAIMRRHIDGVDGRSLRFAGLELDADAHGARIGERGERRGTFSSYVRTDGSRLVAAARRSCPSTPGCLKSPGEPAAASSQPRE